VTSTSAGNSTAGNPTPALVLTAADPVARVVTTVPADPRHVDLRVVSIENPAGRPVVIVVAVDLGTEGRPAVEEVGRLSPYPPAQAGSFQLPVPVPVAATLRGRSQVPVLVALVPVAGSFSPRDVVRVTVAPPVLVAG